MSFRSRLYLILTVIGFVIPNGLILLYIRENGWHLDAGVAMDLLVGNKLVLAFVADLLIACVIYFVWMFREAHKLVIKNAWIYVVLTFAFGLSFSYPLFLFVRQRVRDSSRTHKSGS